MALNPDTNFIGSPSDIARKIIQEQLPDERKGYILAQFVLSMNEHCGANREYSYFSEFAKSAFDALTDEDAGNKLQPPLPDDLRDTLIAYRNEFDGAIRPNRLTGLLLSLVVDHGARQ
ncbi:MAG: hypothetical protein M3Q79_00665 [bacterium]|nr:hypothetical protein [bacterium]